MTYDKDTQNLWIETHVHPYTLSDEHTHKDMTDKNFGDHCVRGPRHHTKHEKALIFFYLFKSNN